MKGIKNIIVIGTSAGGISAVSKLISNLPKDLDAAVLITIHLAKDSRPELIIKRLQKFTSLNCIVPEDGTTIEKQTIYLAPADRHMLVVKDHILIKYGARENHWRPSIDVLFRSAAASYGGCVTGIILTGMLDDGTSGMEAIKKVGGIVIVQDPKEAEFADMSINVMKQVAVDHILKIEDISQTILNRYSTERCEIDGIPSDLKKEAEITIRMSSSVADLQQLAEQSPLTCPDCGGTLMKIKGENNNRYRCYTGHSFSEENLENVQIQGLENSLWVAIRMMEERRNLLNSMDSYHQEVKLERSTALEMHIDRLKKMLTTIGGLKSDKYSN